ncbi:MAG TPA: hypothetical protein VF085_12125 [Solirubrobacterales bacterium]
MAATDSAHSPAAEAELLECTILEEVIELHPERPRISELILRIATHPDDHAKGERIRDAWGSKRALPPIGGKQWRLSTPLLVDVTGDEFTTNFPASHGEEETGMSGLARNRDLWTGTLGRLVRSTGAPRRRGGLER